MYSYASIYEQVLWRHLYHIASLGRERGGKPWVILATKKLTVSKSKKGIKITSKRSGGRKR